MNILYIAGGGAVGALLRYWMSAGIHGVLGQGFPYGTLSVNLAGSISIGFLYVILTGRGDTGDGLWALLIVGLLGGFTTFSAFTLETLNLIEAGEQLKGFVYILSSTLLCLAGCWLGLFAGRHL